jgi:hypothetical protein
LRLIKIVSEKLNNFGKFGNILIKFCIVLINRVQVLQMLIDFEESIRMLMIIFNKFIMYKILSEILNSNEIINNIRIIIEIIKCSK